MLKAAQSPGPHIIKQHVSHWILALQMITCNIHGLEAGLKVPSQAPVYVYVLGDGLALTLDGELIVLMAHDCTPTFRGQ